MDKQHEIAAVIAVERESPLLDGSNLIIVGFSYEPKKSMRRYAVPKSLGIKEQDILVLDQKTEQVGWVSKDQEFEEIKFLETVPYEYNGMTGYEIDVETYGVVSIYDIYGRDSVAPCVWLFHKRGAWGEHPQSALTEKEIKRLACLGYRYAYHPGQKWEQCKSLINYNNKNKND